MKARCHHFRIFELYRLAHRTNFQFVKNRKWIPVDGVFGFYYFSIPFPSICKQSIPIYISIGIDNRYKSITTRIFAIDWSSIININRLIDIDCHRLSILPFGYPGQCHNGSCNILCSVKTGFT